MSVSSHYCCCEVALDLRTYLAGQNQATHPNVIVFDKPWHGYKYWMGYTPYPFANGEKENPSIAASNDMLEWEKPDGLINPIACCEETECDELKDSHLLYNPDTDELELWYLGRIGSTLNDGTPLVLFRKKSGDGRIWSHYEVLYRTEMSELFVSPSVARENGKYYLWGIRNNADEIGLYMMVSGDALEWDDWIKCDVPFARETGMWHGTVTHINGEYQFVWIGINPSCRKIEKQHCIYYAHSTDGISFSSLISDACASVQPHSIISNDTGWRGLYRPCLAFDGNMWYCFYGVIRIDNRWLIGVSKGTMLNYLQGLTLGESRFDGDLVATSKSIRVKKLISDAKGLFVISSAVVMPFLLFFQGIIHNSFYTLFLSFVLCSIYYRFFVWRKNYIYAGLINGGLWGVLTIAIFQLIYDAAHFFIL